MQDFLYIVIGRTESDPCEIWGVAVFEDEEAARTYSEQAAAETRRIQGNVNRATRLRGTPFPDEMLERFRAGNKYDPDMSLSENVIYQVIKVPQANR